MVYKIFGLKSSQAGSRHRLSERPSKLHKLIDIQGKLIGRKMP